MIEEVLRKFDIVPDKFYRLSILYDIFTHIGLISMKRTSFTSDWIKRKIEKGQLVLANPPLKGGHFMITGKQIEDIVNAFIPGGKGYYSYKEGGENA